MSNDEWNRLRPPSSAPIYRFFFWGFGIVLVLSLVGWALGWISVPFRVASPENVREQWRFAYETIEKLDAAARQACAAEKALAAATSDNEKIQRRSQLLALEQNYARIQADYDARVRNALEAKMVKPRDVPDRAPTLEEAKRRVCTS